MDTLLIVLFQFQGKTNSGKNQFLISNDGKWVIAWDNSFYSITEKELNAIVS